MKRIVNVRTLGAAAVAAAVIGGFFARELSEIAKEGAILQAEAATAAALKLPFTYPFSVDGRLEEVGVMENSSSPYWWVSSGAFLDLAAGLGMTNHGDLPLGSKWQKLYAANNPVDTDVGLHPQNIFRMVLRTEWLDVAHEASFRIDADRLSGSPSRSASNGLMQMSRYADENNLYYTGLRVDGYAVIKKKAAGKYYTLAYKPVIKSGKYDRALNPNVLPHGSWIRLKTVTKNLDANRVAIKLYADLGATGTWKLVAEAVDDGAHGGPALTRPGRVGFRTDFMDVSFDDFRIGSAE